MADPVEIPREAGRNAMFFVSDAYSAADEAACAMADHLPDDAQIPELAATIERAISEFFQRLR